MQCLGALLYFENGPTSKTEAIIAAISGLDCKNERFVKLLEQLPSSHSRSCAYCRTISNFGSFSP